LLSAGVTPVIQPIAIQCHTEQIDLRARGRGFGLRHVAYDLGADQTGEEAKDSDHHQQFNQRETPLQKRKR
jgi:hypothetical protein